MKEEPIFSTLHPGLLFFYSLITTVFAMCSLNPLYLGTSLVAALLSYSFYFGVKRTLHIFIEGLPVAFIFAAFNVLFNHRGKTILCRFFDSAITLESFLYGLCSGVMLLTVLMWFRCMNVLLTTQKFLYLFGRRFPNLALLLCMTLRLFPETEERIRCIRQARHSLESMSNRFGDKVKNGMRHISCLLEWSMEGGLDTADSMKARGYGTAERTCGEEYPFTGKDFFWLIVFLVFTFLSAFAIFGKNSVMQYFPELHFSADIWSIILVAFYFVFLILPVLWEKISEVRLFWAQKKIQDRRKRSYE